MNPADSSSSDTNPGVNCSDVIGKIYPVLLGHQGFLNWWPGETPLEVVIGALLTQNTNWNNVSRALNNLKRDNILNMDSIIEMDEIALQELIRPSGYFRQKSERLKSLLSFLRDRYSWDGVSKINTGGEVLRRELLELKGIGPETADSILLYGFNLPFFVVDAYTVRILDRIGIRNLKSERLRTYPFSVRENSPIPFRKLH